MRRKRALLIRARKAAGLTQEEAAYRLGVDRSTIARWESGESEPLPWIRPKLATLLGITLARLEELLVGDTQTDPAAEVGAAVPVTPEDRERITLVARQPRWVDAATVGAFAAVLAATRRLEDQIGSAAVLPGVRDHCALVGSLLAEARGPVRDQVGALAGELHQYLGWLLSQTGHPERARAKLDAALALGVEFDDPDLTSLALSFKGNLSWQEGEAQEVIALSRAATRDQRVFVGLRAYNAYQEARGWAMAREPTELTNGLRELPDAERDSEWAAIFHVGAAEAFTTAGQAERALAHAHQALVVCHGTRSTRLADALQRAHTQMRAAWPSHAPVRELADAICSPTSVHR